MTDIQRKMLELLVEFDGICRKFGIKYCICSGCALGIERHGGYIPWDDDIDLFITKDEYNKLCEVMKTELPEGRAWVTEENYPEYRNPLSRYVDVTTTQLLRSRIDDGTPMGLYLEFFILDPYPSDPEKQKEYDKYLWLFCELKTTRFISAGPDYYRDVLDSELYHSYQKRMEKEGKQAVLDEIEKNYLTYDYDECELLYVRRGYVHSVVRKEWMENLEDRNFEGYMLPFIRDNIDYLCYSGYGFDWDIIPDTRNRMVHDTVVSTTLPIAVHEKEIEEISKKYNFGERMHGNKLDRVERRFIDLDVMDMTARQKKLFLEMLADRAEGYDLRTEYDNLPQLRRLVSRYIPVQTNRRYHLTGTAAEVSDKFLNALLYVMVFNDMMKPIRSVLKTYPDRKVTAKYSKVVDDIISAKMAVYKNQPDVVSRLISGLEKAGFGRQIEVERARMWLAVNGTAGCSEEEILGLWKNLASPEDPVVCKWVGDFYYNKGDMAGAEEWYAKSMDTNNGMILHDMELKGFSSSEKAVGASNEVTAAVLRLFTELQDILEAEGVRYCACGQLPGMIGSKENKMLAKGEMRIQCSAPKALAKHVSVALPKGRELEVLESTAGRTVFRYVDESTAFIEYGAPAKYKHPGIHIEVTAETSPADFPETQVRRYKGTAVRVPADLGNCTENVPEYSNDKYLVTTRVSYKQII